MAQSTMEFRRPSDAPAPDRPDGDESTSDRLRRSARDLLAAAVGAAAGLALRKVDDLAGMLEETVDQGGVGLRAALGAGGALLAGTNPVWGAAKAGFAALGLLGKTLVIAGLVLAPVVLLLLLVLALVALLVAAVVLLVRAATR